MWIKTKKGRLVSLAAVESFAIADSRGRFFDEKTVNKEEEKQLGKSPLHLMAFLIEGKNEQRFFSVTEGDFAHCSRTLNEINSGLKEQKLLLPLNL